MSHNALNYLWAGLMAAALSVPEANANPNGITLKKLGTYASGKFGVSAAEIVAHDPATQRVFVINALSAEVDVISIADPAAPVKVGTIEAKKYGAGANSVAVRNGLIAVAVENKEKTDPGQAVFFDSALRFVAQVEVGALPDMITFTPNGRYVLVANEGEPNSLYTVDPEGSVSIIDMKGGAKKLNQSKVRTASFVPFNTVPIDPAIRIFGLNNPTVAEDLEPEYITVSHDSKTAWVTLQENNALAIVDIPSAKVKSLVALGTKDHAAIQARAILYNFKPEILPSIGTTLGGQSIPLGGFSGLAFEGISSATGRYKFVTHTDRGPNAEPNEFGRPFLLPDFAPEVVRFEVGVNSGEIVITQRIQLKDADGELLTGLPNTAISNDASQPFNDEVPVDLLDNKLPLDPLGADMEGIVFEEKNGTFWMCDEYRPALYHFKPDGVLIKRYVPKGTALAAGEPEGTFGEEVLPAVLAQRRQNRGFEAIAIDNGLIYAFVQSPLRNPVRLSNGALSANRNVRLVEFDPVKQTSRQFIYVMDNPNLGPPPNSRADKIGDAVSLGNGEFLVVERDDDKLPDDVPATIEKKIYQFNLNGATELSEEQSTGLIGDTGKSVDQLTVKEMVANEIYPVEKQLYVDLNIARYNRTEKVEGLAVIDPWTIAVINDNDFGVADIDVKPDGTFVRNYVPEPVQLGIVKVRHNGLDASNSDDNINIRPWPVKGLYMPDSIASYRVGGKTYLLTANEGDAREYGEYEEPVRVGNRRVVLDPEVFPNPSVIKNNANLGRLNISSASGRNPDGSYRELHAFGARSFTIWDAAGKLVFDSGDDLEWIAAQAYPDFFNTSNSNSELENRSDDKGPEPEGVVVGRAFGRDFAFIGLERIGGVVVYDISNPRAPVYVDYINNRNFEDKNGEIIPLSFPPDPNDPKEVKISNPAAGDLGPEGLHFIKAEDSPTGRPMLVVGNEVSGTTTLFDISKADINKAE